MYDAAAAYLKWFVYARACMCVYVCVRVCVREREREREKGGADVEWNSHLSRQGHRMSERSISAQPMPKQKTHL